MAAGRHVRVRFAPAPTGMLHLGNIRAALCNFLCARAHNGTYILRVEDTDPQRIYDPQAQHIMESMSWLGLTYDEGPQIGGPHAPYFQSQRHETYRHFFQLLYEKGYLYRSFETPEELEQQRQRQRALKMPPRYRRSGLMLSEEEITKRLANNTPYVWRLQLPETEITIHDIARGAITFDLRDFSDFAITRQNGSFTFLFANFVDDYVMGITHVMRGEDHLSNSAQQGALYQIFQSELPTFYHLPVIVNQEGQKLSKRDFGYSLADLRRSGFLPEAICNYLAILGSSFEQEIMDLSEMIQHVTINKHSPTGKICYDVDKLRWMNHQWIQRLDPPDVAERSRPFLKEAYPEQVQAVSDDMLTHLVATLQTDITTLTDTVDVFAFYFTTPDIPEIWLDHFDHTAEKPFLEQLYREIDWNQDADTIFQQLKQMIRQHDRSIKTILSLIRLALTGKPQGPGIKDLLSLLSVETIRERLYRIC